MSNEFTGGYNPQDGVYYAKGSFDNEIEYNNEVICLVNHIEDYFNGMGQAMKEKNFHHVEPMIAEFIEVNTSNIESLNQLGAYEGDDELLNTAINYLNTINDLLKTDYRQTYLMVKDGNHTEEELKTQQNIFGEKYVKSTQSLSQAFEKFLDKYSEEEEMDVDLSELYSGFERKEYDESNPLLQPIHGISLEDYAAAASHVANGVSEEDVAKALGVEIPQWEEANALWIKRMQQDTDFTIASLYGQYFATAGSHPKFQNVQNSFETNQENLARIKEDPEFYFELSAAMRAAHNYGMDGAQWLRDNYGLSLGDFQSVAMQWAYSPVFAAMIPKMEETVKEYEAKFAKEMGGNIADDIEF